MSSATIASTICSELRLMFWADWRLRRSPVTTISFSSAAAARSNLTASSVCAEPASGSAGDSWASTAGSGGVTGSLWAMAGAPAKARMAADDEHRMKVFRRMANASPLVEPFSGSLPPTPTFKAAKLTSHLSDLSGGVTRGTHDRLGSFGSASAQGGFDLLQPKPARHQIELRREPLAGLGRSAGLERRLPHQQPRRPAGRP